MKNTDENRKDKVIAWCITVGTIGLMLILLLACSLKTQVPPPPPKKMVYVDIASIGGGGGGGTPNVASKPKPSSGENLATQNAQDAPAVNHSDRTTTNRNTQPAPSTPKPDQSSMYRGRGGTGSGGGSGSGIGSGTGSGLGPGEGAGSGGGVGYGTGHRGLVQQINTTINEQGQICVEVHVAADGHVIDARVINNAKHKTTITNRNAQQQCVARAKQAVYNPGKEELRIIIFS